MRLWTIQDRPAHQRLLNRGVLYGDWRRVDAQCFKPAYKWLCDQMEKRGIRLRGRPPMWAWPHKPDMRTSAHNYRGKNGVVLLELEVPDELVLLSHFNAWHCVLNDHYLVTRDDELEGMFDHPRHAVEASWQLVFDRGAMAAIPGYDDLYQATFPTIKVEQIVSARQFAAR